MRLAFSGKAAVDDALGFVAFERDIDSEPLQELCLRERGEAGFGAAKEFLKELVAAGVTEFLRIDAESGAKQHFLFEREATGAVVRQSLDRREVVDVERIDFDLHELRGCLDELTALRLTDIALLNFLAGLGYCLGGVRPVRRRLDDLAGACADRLFVYVLPAENVERGDELVATGVADEIDDETAGLA